MTKALAEKRRAPPGIRLQPEVRRNPRRSRQPPMAEVRRNLSRVVARVSRVERKHSAVRSRRANSKRLGGQLPGKVELQGAPDRTRATEAVPASRSARVGVAVAAPLVELETQRRVEIRAWAGLPRVERPTAPPRRVEPPARALRARMRTPRQTPEPAPPPRLRAEVRRVAVRTR